MDIFYIIFMDIFYIIFIKLMLWYVYIILTTLFIKFLTQLIKKKLLKSGEEDTSKIEYLAIICIFINFFISWYVALLLVFN